MAKPRSSALRLFRTLQPSVCASCRAGPPAQRLRQFSSTVPGFAAQTPSENAFDSLMGNVGANFQRRPGTFDSHSSLIPGQSQEDYRNLAKQEWEEEERHHLHVYSTKHNTHITLTNPKRDALISVSCGNIGFRKAGRSTYDAAYQLAAFVFSRIQDKGLLPQINKLEIVYRNFGQGREAVTKALLGNEGRRIRPLVDRLSDSTRLKFGGVRSKKPRRLG